MKKVSVQQDAKGKTAIIVGASLSGLMTAISLAREGMQVTVLEKVGEEQRYGSGLQVNGGKFELSKTAKLLRELASGGKHSVQLWSDIEYRLRKEALTSGQIRIKYNTKVQSVHQDEVAAWVITEKEEKLNTDILIGADGHRSIVRQHVSPNNPNAIYAGYIVWIINPMDEADLPIQIRPTNESTGVTMLHGPHGFLFGSIIDNKGGAADTGKRRIGCAWYDNTRSELLKSLGSVVDNVVHHSLHGPDIPESTLLDLKQEATLFWQEPWLSATIHAIHQRGITGIPIKEYTPNKLAHGRIALVGDAAHVPAPITASGFNESLQDAVALGKCVANNFHGGSPTEAMKEYETMRIYKAQQMVLSGKSFSKSFGQP